MRIGLFVPCYIDAFFPEVGIATLELLERFGHEVVYPRDQTCCGQPMANSGFNADCAATEALFVRNFSGFDYIVAPSESCVHHVRDNFDAIEQTPEVIIFELAAGGTAWMHTMTMASCCVGLTFPGMMDEPGSFSGNSSSFNPQRGPEASQRTSLAIFMRATASPRTAAIAATIASSEPWAANLLGAVTNGWPVSVAIVAAISRLKSGGALSPVPTASPPGSHPLVWISAAPKAVLSCISRRGSVCGLETTTCRAWSTRLAHSCMSESWSHSGTRAAVSSAPTAGSPRKTPSPAPRWHRAWRSVSASSS
ncbi:MAG: iron-sulfur (Fe-S) oxidoreductase [Gammaproteobacteria bacterium]|nr:iron-sulfur (Fe-S) oxidoreductase [Gammaproteobacteria bacterium]